MSKSYTVTDRRRVTADGAVRTPMVRQPRPRIAYKTFKDKVQAVWRHVSTHLERGLQTRAHGSDLYWTYIWGLALSTKQTYDAIVTLVADRLKPLTLPLQSGILTRAMLEVLGNVMALTANPKSLRRFLADGYRRHFEQLQVQHKIWGGRPDWKDWFSGMDLVLKMKASDAGLSVRRARHPSSIVEWPSPYWLTRSRRIRGRKRPFPVLLRGNRAALFEEAYRFWYSLLSAYAHQRSAAAEQAIFAANPDSHWEPGIVESNAVSEAILFFACIMSELEVATQMPLSVDLRALWSELWDFDEEAKRLVSIRYRRLLHLPNFGAAA